MKKIEAIVKSSRLELVRKAIARVCIEDPTFTEVTGLGRQRAQIVRYRGSEFRIDVVPMAKLELVVPDEVAGRVVRAIFDAARTGSKGDGRIFISGRHDAWFPERIKPPDNRIVWATCSLADASSLANVVA